MRTDGRRLPHNLLEQYRLAAINLYKSKVDIKVIAQSFGVTVQAVYKWVWKFEQEGLGGLKSTTAQGAAPQLSQQQVEELLHHLKSPATAAGFPTDLWTSPRVRQLIQKLFNVDYHPKHLPRLLRRLGLSFKRPQDKASKQDSPAIRQWKQEKLPEIMAHAQEKKALLLYADESLVNAQSGVVTAVNEQGRAYFEVAQEEEIFTCTRFMDFLRTLLAEFPSRQIILIVDAASFHSEAVVLEFLENNPRLRLEILPAAAFAGKEKEVPEQKQGKLEISQEDGIPPTDV